MDDFQKVLAAVSVQSFLDHEVTFAQPRAIEYIKKAKEISNVVVSPKDYFEDLLRAVSLLMQDGVYYSFTHKQFQEYYTAYFVNQTSASKQRSLLKRIAPEFQITEVVKIFHELNPSVSERLFILPLIQSILKRIKFDGSFDDGLFCRYFCTIISAISVSNSKKGLKASGYHANQYRVFEQFDFIRSAYLGQVSFNPGHRRPLDEVLSADVVRARCRNVNGGTVIPITTAKLSADRELQKLLRSEGYPANEQVKFLVDVRDFVKHKLARNAKSIDNLLV